MPVCRVVPEVGALLVLSWNTVGPWLALVPAGLLLWLLARHVLPTLLARFDGRALRVTPPGGLAVPPAAPLDAAQRAAGAALAAWCHAGSGDGRRPWWHPGARPRVQRRLAVAVLRGGTLARQLALVDAFARQLDGTDRLHASRGRWAGWRLRLRVKRDDCQWWRARQPQDPWDCGYLGDDDAARAALRAFRPRRATLLLAAGLPSGAVAEAQAALTQNRERFAHPVRLLWLQPGDTPAAPAVADGDGAAVIVLGCPAAGAGQGAAGAAGASSTPST
jgi:hypothetical protein